MASFNELYFTMRHILMIVCENYFYDARTVHLRGRASTKLHYVKQLYEL